MSGAAALAVRAGRAAVLAALALATGGCDPSRRIAEGTSPSGGTIQVAVPIADDGSFDPAPAYARANEICAERFRAAVYFMGRNLGADERLLIFRCE